MLAGSSTASGPPGAKRASWGGKIKLAGRTNKRRSRALTSGRWVLLFVMR
jgi:hypothetical protein